MSRTPRKHYEIYPLEIFHPQICLYLVSRLEVLPKNRPIMHNVGVEAKEPAGHQQYDEQAVPGPAGGPSTTTGSERSQHQQAVRSNTVSGECQGTQYTSPSPCLTHCTGRVPPEEQRRCWQGTDSRESSRTERLSSTEETE